MPAQPAERNISEQDPYAQIRAKIDLATKTAQAAIDYFNGSLFLLNKDLQTARDGRREIIDAENEARSIRANLGFQELSRRGLDFCSGSHTEILTEADESLTDDEKLRRLGVIPHRDLTIVAYRLGNEPENPALAARFCRQHQDVEEGFTRIDPHSLGQEKLDEILAKRVENAFSTYRGMTILDVLGIPALELSQGAIDIKQAISAESFVPHVIWPILPTISGNPRDVIARYTPQPTTKSTS